MSGMIRNIKRPIAQAVGEFSTSLASSSGSNQIGFLQLGAGSVLRNVDAKLKEFVSVKDFGAVGDGVADDTAAIQAAINYCATFTHWPAMMLTGKHKITDSLIVDRLVDTNTSQFRIVANGPGAGFYTTGNVTIFDSTISVTIDPRSEFISFEGVRFESSSFFNDSQVLSKKFLRVKFVNCFFFLIRCAISDIYAQDIHFIGCDIRNSPSGFMNVAGCYDILFLGCLIQNNFRLVRCIDAARGTNGLHIIGCGIDGQQESTVTLTGVSGFILSGNHIESGPAIDFNFWGGSLTNNSIHITGNYIYNPGGATFYYAPGTVAVYSAGNTVFPSVMHSNAVQVTNLVSIGDSCSGGVSDSPNTSVVNGVYRAGNLEEAWTHSANHFTKSKAGEFAFGRTPLAGQRAVFWGQDTSSNKYAAVAYDSNGFAIFSARNDRVFSLPSLVNYSSDAAAAAGNIPVGGLYRNGQIVQVRVT